MPRPLEGVRVVGFEQQIAAPYCTMILADQGAQVAAAAATWDWRRWVAASAKGNL